MGSNRRNIILSFQLKNGGDAPLVFEITQSKMDKIVQIIQPEVDKKKKQESCTSVNLEEFFVTQEAATDVETLVDEVKEFLEETKDYATPDPEDLEYERLRRMEGGIK